MPISRATFDLCEWQLHDANQWAFGLKVRGVIRHRLAEVYYDESSNDPRGGWRWYANLAPMDRGVSNCLEDAVSAAEQALEVI